MSKKRVPTSQLAFNDLPSLRREPHVKIPTEPIWTRNKAKLIERYLFYFVMITKHGNYIDACAGPQQADNADMWSARLVLESQPRWFRKFFLFDKDAEQVKKLEALRDAQPPPDKEKREQKRLIHVERGDCNVLIPKLLGTETIRDKEATFCLLDQRTFECEWATLV